MNVIKVINLFESIEYGNRYGSFACSKISIPKNMESRISVGPLNRNCEWFGVMVRRKNENKMSCKSSHIMR